MRYNERTYLDYERGSHSLFWHEIQFRSRQERLLDATDMLSLSHLYQPIVGAISIGLYVTLHSQAVKHGFTSLLTHTYLFKLLSISHNQLLEARYQLEGAGLLRTFEKGEYLEYQVVPPLSPLTFFQTKPLTLQLHQQLGDESFKQIKADLLSHVEETNSINLTKSFQEVFGIKTGELKKALSTKRKMDLQFVKSCLTSIIHPSNWNSGLESELLQACHLFQLDEQSLITALQRPEVTYRGSVHLQSLFQYLQSTRSHSQHSTVQKVIEPELSPEQKHFQLLATISPFELLANYQGGAAIPKSELDLVQSLLHDYQLPSGVVNVLLDFVLLKCDRKLPKYYVEKIASHWKRLNIQTVEQAKSQALKENGKQTNEPAKAKRKQVKKLPKTIAREIVQPSITKEELQGTYDDIYSSMNLLRNPVKQVLHDSD